MGACLTSGLGGSDVRTYNVNITVEGDDPDGMAIPNALDLFNDINPDGITLHWNWDEVVA